MSVVVLYCPLISRFYTVVCTSHSDLSVTPGPNRLSSTTRTCKMTLFWCAYSCRKIPFSTVIIYIIQFSYSRPRSVPNLGSNRWTMTYCNLFNILEKPGVKRVNILLLPLLRMEYPYNSLILLSVISYTHFVNLTMDTCHSRRIFYRWNSIVLKGN